MWGAPGAQDQDREGPPRPLLHWQGSVGITGRRGSKPTWETHSPLLRCFEGPPQSRVRRGLSVGLVGPAV